MKHLVAAILLSTTAASADPLYVPSCAPDTWYSVDRCAGDPPKCHVVVRPLSYGTSDATHEAYKVTARRLPKFLAIRMARQMNAQASVCMDCRNLWRLGLTDDLPGEHPCYVGPPK